MEKEKFKSKYLHSGIWLNCTCIVSGEIRMKLIKHGSQPKIEEQVMQKINWPGSKSSDFGVDIFESFIVKL